MSLSLTTVFCARNARIARVSNAPAALPCVRVKSVAVANGCAWALVDDGSPLPLLYEVDLVSGAVKLLGIGAAHLLSTRIAADYVVGALGGVPVLAHGLDRQMSVWLFSHPDQRIYGMPELSFGLLFVGALWFGTKWEDGQVVAVGVGLDNDQLVPVRMPYDDYIGCCTRFEQGALKCRRLPIDCPSVSLYMLPLMAAIGASPGPIAAPLADFAAGGPADIVFDGCRGFLDGRTGAVAWIEAGSLRVLRGGWRTSADWKPDTHHLFAAEARARAVAIIVCLYRWRVQLSPIVLSYILDRALD